MYASRILGYFPSLSTSFSPFSCLEVVPLEMIVVDQFSLDFGSILENSLYFSFFYCQARKRRETDCRFWMAFFSRSSRLPYMLQTEILVSLFLSPISFSFSLAFHSWRLAPFPSGLSFSLSPLGSFVILIHMQSRQREEGDTSILVHTPLFYSSHHKDTKRRERDRVNDCCF